MSKQRIRPIKGSPKGWTAQPITQERKAKQKRENMLRILVGLLPAVSLVSGHARLVEPPSRASMWRYGFDTPPNYNDNEGFCGGFFVIKALQGKT